MEVNDYINKKKELYTLFIDYIENDENSNNIYQSLIDFINTNKYFEMPNEMKGFLFTVSQISGNHHRNSGFFDKIDKILLYLRDSIKKTLPNTVIYSIFKYNKRILLFLLKNSIIPIDDNRIITDILYKGEKNNKMYFFNVLKSKINDIEASEIKNQLLKIDSNIFSYFDEKCQKGENDSYLCTLIRNDSIEEFVTYAHQTNLSLSDTIIPSSIFETNSFLIKNQPTIIEYATFYGSIQIFQYLKINKVELKPSLWLYAIHSNNADIIHLLEDNKVPPFEHSFEKCLEESIKCHHNHIANYIISNLLKRQVDSDYLKYATNGNLLSYCFRYFNYDFIPDNIKSNLLIHYSFYFHDYDFVVTFNIAVVNNSEIVRDSINDVDFDINEELLQLPTLKTLSIQSTVNTIANNTFYECKSLEKVFFPLSIETINDFAFNGCTALKEITFEDNISLKTVGIYAFGRCSSLIKISLPSSLIDINEHAFDGCSALTEIVFPSSVDYIGSSAFIDCCCLKSLTFPSSLSYIGYSSFCRCSSLVKVEFESPSSLTYIGDNAFCGCSALSDIQIPSLVTYIGANAFENCRSLYRISIPSELVYQRIGIGDNVEVIRT